MPDDGVRGGAGMAVAKGEAKGDPYKMVRFGAEAKRGPSIHQMYDRRARS